MNLLNRPRKPFTDDLRRMLGANSNPRTLKAFEQLFEAVPGDFNSLIVEIEALDVRVTELEPNYIVITSDDSPYTAANNDYILCDIDGDIDIVFPDDGRFFVSRKGQSFDLTLLETVSGKVSPKILFDRSTAAIAKIGDDWRFV